MFGILKSLVKTATAVVDIPVAVVADVVTLGGTKGDKNKPYTSDAAGRLVQHVEGMADQDKRD